MISCEGWDALIESWQCRGKEDAAREGAMPADVERKNAS